MNLFNTRDAPPEQDQGVDVDWVAINRTPLLRRMNGQWG